jgi:hypothetical protein
MAKSKRHVFTATELLSPAERVRAARRRAVVASVVRRRSRETGSGRNKGGS